MFAGSSKESEDFGVQKWRTNYKYSKEVPVVIATPSGTYRFYPELDTETGEPLPYVEGSQLTWARFELGVDFLGINLPGQKRNYSFWVIPGDIERIYKDEIAGLESGDARTEYKIHNSPYYIFYYAMEGSASDPAAPPEWAVFNSRKEWPQVSIVEGDYAPMPDAEEHALVRAQLLSNASKTYKSTTYTDGRSDGSIHPVVLEFKKSATAHIKIGPFFVLSGDGLGKSAYLHSGLLDPQEGGTITMASEDKRFEGGQTFVVHRFDLEESRPYPVSLAEIQKEWRPWTDPTTFMGQLRLPIQKRLPAAEQITLLLSAFGEEAVDYAFRNTPYYQFVPPAVQGTFEAFAGKHYGVARGVWYNMFLERCAGREGRSSNKATKADKDTIRSPHEGTNLSDPRTVLSPPDVSDASKGDGTPGSYDRAKAQGVLDQLEAEKTAGE